MYKPSRLASCLLAAFKKKVSPLVDSLGANDTYTVAVNRMQQASLNLGRSPPNALSVLSRLLHLSVTQN